MTTEAALLAAARASDGAAWASVDRIRVFARMSPHGKARVIRTMQQRMGHFVLMCGDGGNDVGALKQADTGLALLSGYGNANTADALSGKKDESPLALTDGEGGAGGEGAGGAAAGAAAGAAGGAAGAAGSETALNEQSAELKKKAAAGARLRNQLFKKKQQEIAGKQQLWLKEELDRRQAAGEEIGVMTQFAAMKNVAMRMKDEMQARGGRGSRGGAVARERALARIRGKDARA